MADNTHRLDDGFSTTFTFVNAPTIKLWEKEVTPPGITQGGAIDTTTMRNTSWRTMAPKALRSLTAVSATVAYATVILEGGASSIYAQLGVNQLITINFPDGSALTFWGFLNEFTPGANVEGEQPTATITIEPTNRNEQTGEEAPPSYAEPAET